VDALHTVYPAAADIKDKHGNVLVTAYALDRPDGQWAVLLVNKDQSNSHSVYVSFEDAGTGAHYFQNTVTKITFGPDEYFWHVDGANGYAKPDGPAANSTESGGKGTQYVLPAASVTVLRATID
jgi:hypothetical protein